MYNQTFYFDVYLEKPVLDDDSQSSSESSNHNENVTQFALDSVSSNPSEAALDSVSLIHKNVTPSVLDCVGVVDSDGIDIIDNSEDCMFSSNSNINTQLPAVESII